MTKTSADLPPEPLTPAALPDLHSLAGVRDLGVLCHRLVAALPDLGVTPQDSLRLGGILFREGPPFVYLLCRLLGDAHIVDRAGRAPGLWPRQQRALALRCLLSHLQLLSDRVKQHYQVEQAAILRDARTICQDSLAAHPGFSPLRVAERLLQKKLGRARRRDGRTTPRRATTARAALQALLERSC